MGTCCSLHQPPMHMEASPYPLSSRAQPRDLQFCRPVLEMFFDRVRMQVEVKVCGAYGTRTMLGNRCLSPAGLGGLLAVGPTGLKAQTASSKNIARTGLQNCRSLGCARDDKGEGDASLESGYQTEGVFP